MKKIVLISSVIIFAVLCVVFNKYDLDISIALTKHNNAFCEFLDDFGEMPIYIGPILFGSIYFLLSKKTYQRVLSVSVVFLSYLIIYIKILYNMQHSFNVINGVIGVVSVALIGCLTIYLLSKVKKETLCNIKDLALLGFLVAVISFACVEIIKYTWGRVRFRDLSADYSEFTNLFHINGLTGHKSFPSGHTNAGTSILLVALLVPRFTDKKWLKYLTTVLCFGYIATLAVSRIIVSAHYASDVLVGFVVGFVTLCITYSVLRRKGVLNVASNKC